MKLSRIVASAALAWAGTLSAWSGDEPEPDSGRRVTGRILLSETSPSEILFESPSRTSDYTGGEDAANRLLGFVSEYGELGPRPPDLYEPNANLLLLFADLLEFEIHRDPFYLFGRRVDPHAYPYEEQSWNALGGALRRKYQFVRAADQAIRRVQDATTLSYQAQSGVTFKVRPAIEDIMDSNKMRLRVACLSPGVVDKIEAKVGLRDVRLTIGKKNIFRGRLTEIQVIYEGRSGEEASQPYENLGELTLAIPFW